MTVELFPNLETVFTELMSRDQTELLIATGNQLATTYLVLQNLGFKIIFFKISFHHVQWNISSQICYWNLSAKNLYVSMTLDFK